MASPIYKVSGNKLRMELFLLLLLALLICFITLLFDHCTHIYCTQSTFSDTRNKTQKNENTEYVSCSDVTFL